MNNSSDSVCAVIFTAITVEYQAVRIHLRNLKEEVHPDGAIYERGTFISGKQKWRVGLVETRMGIARATFEVGRAIDYFKPKLVFFVGVAGGLKDVRIGDVVAATKVYNYESGKAGITFQPRPESFNSSYPLVKRAEAEVRSQNQDWRKRIISAPSNLPYAFAGAIVAGDKVIASTHSSIWTLLKRNYGNALAVEMEGYGFLQAVYGNQNVQALVVRGISDLIDGKSATDAAGSQELAARHASAFAFEVLSKVKIDELQRSSSVDKRSTKKPQQSANTQLHQRTKSGNIISPIGDYSNITSNYSGVLEGLQRKSRASKVGK